MTENAFMTHGAWYKATKAIIYGYNEMPVIRYNTQWAILEFLDGFGYHEYEPRTLKMRAEINILSAKEESKKVPCQPIVRSIRSQERQEDSSRDPCLTAQNEERQQGRC